jgi:DNA-binding beta-propeller fold protein YncE
MRRFTVLGSLLLFNVALIGTTVWAQVAPTAFTNFEGAQTNPIRMSSDGTRLYAVNTPAAMVSIFDISSASTPSLLAEIPVGIEPVSVNPRTDDEVWVVNQESNSISIASVSQGIVTATISCKSEPADVVFAGSNLAFVSVARSNQVNVYNVLTHALVATIPLTGQNPRALAASADGSTVYAAFALAGNQTTPIPANDAPPPPPPTNTQLPTPPQVALIVSATDPNWSSVVDYTVPSNGVAAINTTTLEVTNYYPLVGTVNLGIAVQPTTGNVYVANTNALNLVMFETNLNGHIVDHQITSINTSTGAVTPINLNPGINYSVLPNPSAVASALAQPAGLAFGPSGQTLYVAAFGTDRVGIFNTQTNQVTSFIEIDPQATGSTVNPPSKRGPRGLALNSSANILYVLNRIANSISVVNLANNTVTSEIRTGTFDPTPAVIRAGRGFLYDHKLSGNGTGACASCHVDGDMDFLAWNLGNPDGSEEVVTQGSNTFDMSPMKGPMTTQTLRGLVNLAPYHWRGDQPNFAAFNTTFPDLLGGTELTTSQMTAFTNYINTLAFMPNPNENLNRTLPNSIPLPDLAGATGDPVTGQSVFVNTPFNSEGQTCNTCHTASNFGPGTNTLIIPATAAPSSQPFKVPELRNQYQKAMSNFIPGTVDVIGFGFRNDGTNGLFQFLSGPEFTFFFTNTTVKQNLEAYMLCFDTGTAPAVGFSITLTSSNVTNSTNQSNWSTLQSQALAGYIALVANGTVNGKVNGLLYQPSTNNYSSSTTGIGPFTQSQLISLIEKGDTLTLMGVPAGSGSWMAFERVNGGSSSDAQPQSHTKRR